MMRKNRHVSLATTILLGFALPAVPASAHHAAAAVFTDEVIEHGELRYSELLRHRVVLRSAKVSSRPRLRFFRMRNRSESDLLR